MSNKIPETEWATVAARRESGESVAAIARDYGCSPALIYSVLKKVSAPEQEPPNLAPAPNEPVDTVPSASVVQPQATPVAPLEAPPSAGGAERPTDVPVPPAKAPSPAGASMEAPRRSTMDLAGDARASTAPRSAKPTALTANLDDALRAEAEAAISRFKDALATALGSKDPAVLEALRQASSELMRIGARTSIVVERLASAADRPRPSAPREVTRAHDRTPAVRASSSGGELADSDALLGTVKWFNPDKGFGFVAVDGAGDVYVSLRAVQSSGLSTLQEGERVRLTTRPGPRGPQATRLEALDSDADVRA
jgi:cold shock CspA family protein